MKGHLVLSSVLHNLLIDDLIHDLEALDGFLLCDTNIGLLQGHRAETTGGKRRRKKKKYMRCS